MQQSSIDSDQYVNTSEHTKQSSYAQFEQNFTHKNARIATMSEEELRENTERLKK